MSALSPARRLEDGFRGAVVVVLGGRGGIGAAVVAQARALGATVIVGTRSPGADDPSDPGVETLAVDLTDTATIKAFAETVEARHGRIDILVNAAGITRPAPLNDLSAVTDELIDEVFASNTRGAFAAVRELLPLLRQGRDPVVITISSVAARTGVGSSVAYVGAKAAMDAMTVSMAKALGPDIRFMLVAPSALRTGFVENRPEAFFDTTIAASPLGRLAEPDEIASAVIASARLLTASTGTVIYVDCGRHL